MKKKLGILSIIFITILCIYLGIQTRKNSAIKVTQIQTNTAETLSYMLETEKNNIIMIDGGNFDDAEHLEQVLLDKGGNVNSWYITLAHIQNFGALQKILENGKVKVENIYISFDSQEWYEEYENARCPATLEFLNVVNEKKQPITGIPPKFEIKIDNLYITALNIANPELNKENAGFNQSMVIKVNNTYKSMIFMGDSAREKGEFFRDNNLDEVDCDIVQVSNNGTEYVREKIYQEMTPQYLLMSVPKETDSEKAMQYIERLKNLVRAEQTYLSCNGDTTVEIW